MVPTFLAPESVPYASVTIVSAPQLRLICAWCTRQLRDGALPASHTICPPCTARFVVGATS